MYEIELRALIKNFEEFKNKLDNIAKVISKDEREVTIYFINEAKEGFDLRLRLKKDTYIISYKESLSKSARKEIESEISNPKAIYDLLIESGFKIRMIVARINYKYIKDNFEILLNRVVDWGDALEVETMIYDKEKVNEAEESIKQFMYGELGITELFTKEQMKKINDIYCSNNKLNITVEELIDYVNGKKEIIKLVN